MIASNESTRTTFGDNQLVTYTQDAKKKQVWVLIPMHSEALSAYPNLNRWQGSALYCKPVLKVRQIYRIK